jgi:tetratricopeptide (TPR) repeat protein
VRLGIAQSLEALGRAREAEAEFQAAIREHSQLQPANRGRADFDPRLHYAVFLYRQGRTEEARTPADAVARDHPNSPRARYEAGRILHQLGDLEAAARELEAAVQLGHGAPAHLLLGKVYMRVGKAAEAQKHLEAGAAKAQ